MKTDSPTIPTTRTARILETGRQHIETFLLSYCAEEGVSFPPPQDSEAWNMMQFLSLASERFAETLKPAQQAEAEGCPAEVVNALIEQARENYLRFVAALETALDIADSAEAE